MECVLDLVWSMILRYSLYIAIFDEQNIADDNISFEAVRDGYVLVLQHCKFIQNCNFLSIK